MLDFSYDFFLNGYLISSDFNLEDTVFTMLDNDGFLNADYFSLILEMLYILGAIA